MRTAELQEVRPAAGVKVVARWAVFGVPPGGGPVECCGWANSNVQAYELGDIQRKLGWTDLCYKPGADINSPPDHAADDVYVPYCYKPVFSQDNPKALLQPPKIAKIDQHARWICCKAILAADTPKGLGYARDRLAVLYLSAGYKVLARCLRDAADGDVKKHARMVLEGCANG